MKKRTLIVTRARLLPLILGVLPGVALAQPALTVFNFTPGSINTSSAAVDVTVKDIERHAAARRVHRRDAPAERRIRTAWR